MQPAGKHIPGLDSLRGLAILLVFVFHVVGTATSRLDAWINWMRIGVDLFFALSGFLITRILLATKSDEHYFRNFYARRTLRIFPLYYGVLFVVTAMAVVRGRLSDLGDDMPWVWSYLTNWRIVEAGRWLNSPRHFCFDHFWSLAVEEQFYLAWPAVIWLLTTRQVIRACAGAILFAAAFRVYLSFTAQHHAAPFVHTFARIDGLCWGALLACVLELKRPPQGAYRNATLLVCFLCAVGLVLIGVRHALSLRDPYVARVALALTGPLCASIVYLVISAPSRHWLDRAWLRWLGKYSYGLYVLHYLVLREIYGRASALLLRVTGSEALTATIFVIGSSVGSVALAVLSYHLYEKHFLQLKRYFEAREPAPALPATPESIE